MREILDNIRLYPRSCVWEVTFKCNLRCLHCASDANSGNLRGRELTLSEAIKVCKDLHFLGCKLVTLSGGEALLRKDWDQIARQLVSLNIKVMLFSNGLIIDSKIARQIKDVGICLVGLSIDGTEFIHNYIRNNPKSFIRVKRAASCLNEQGIPVNFVTSVNKMNLPRLREIEDIVVSLNANAWRIQLASPVGRLRRHPYLVIEPNDLPAIADFIIEAKRRNHIRISVGDNIGYFSRYEAELRETPERKGLNFFCGCSAGCLNIGIESDGNVKGCLSLQSDQFIEGNVREESLIQIWQKKGSFAYTREFKVQDLHGNCKGCEYGEICRGGCKFMALGATGSPYSNPYCLYTVLKNKT